ncbi:kynureninase [Marinoscillum furvescens]|uniref:Kynureninase n=1 Tax=Marinoscillum furvescens DSM 4134 TaxID=1122208 RepID=A0A3D9KXG1_MARFU|nr:kynureninase [Marinoscillum furvescens]RED93630.1 kynureninase [Marinoscillum furvescens DSM 4134]
MNFENTPDFAKAQDQNDNLKHFREQFHIPQKNGKPTIYFCGNSLGVQPKITEEYVQGELSRWREKGVEGHFDGDDAWADYHLKSKNSLAKLTGAKPLEVVAMNNLTTNLHLLLASFYQPKGKRVKLMIEGGAFPSDHYAAESHMKRMGIAPEEHLITLTPKSGECFTTEEIVEAIHATGDELALVMFPGVQYYTGQFFDMKAITAAAHEVGAFAGFDLAHAMGNLPMSLHADGVDFAAWCTYKYLNSGPGAVSGIFIHEKHCTDANFPKLTGWWGHDRKTRFKMDNQFVPNPGADGWMLSNSNIITQAAHLASLSVFDQTDITALRAKSLRLTGYLEYLLTHDEIISQHIRLITPTDPEQRGCQLSMYIDQNGKSIFDGLIANGVILDWREPNVIRVAPTPLYNTFEEVWHFCQLLRKLIETNAG